MAEPVDMVPRLHSMRTGKRPPQVDITNRKKTLKLWFSLFFYTGWRGSFLRSSVFWMPAVCLAIAGKHRGDSTKAHGGFPQDGRLRLCLGPALHPSTPPSLPTYLPTYLFTHMDIYKYLHACGQKDVYLVRHMNLISMPFSIVFSVLATSKNTIITPHSIKVMVCQSRATCPATEKKKRFVRPDGQMDR